MSLDRDTIGVARGIGIVLVVFAHIVPSAGPFFVPYAFHMPLFFFLSGLTLSADRPIGQLMLKDLTRVVGFYLVMIFVLALISGPLQAGGASANHTSIYNWKTYFLFPFTRNSHHVELFLVGWFLVALLFAKYVAIVVLRVSARLGSPILVAACLAVVIGWIGMNVLSIRFSDGSPWYWNLSSQICVATMYCVLGALIRQAPIAWPEKAFWPAVATYLLLLMSGAPPLVMSWSQYPGRFALHGVGTALGIAATLLAARVLRESIVLQVVGQHSKAIMSWHLASFAVLSLWYVQMSGFQQTGVFGMFRPELYWPIYLATGLILPVALAIAWTTMAAYGKGVARALLRLWDNRQTLTVRREMPR